VIAFQTEISPLYRLLMWRNAAAVFVQPLVGRGKQYGSVAGALQSLLPTPRHRRLHWETVMNIDMEVGSLTGVV
jgi:hypothetical protein